MKVIIVDDDIFVRRCLCIKVPWESLGFDTVIEAENGSVAYDLALKEEPNLVISDVKMPILNGLELSRKLREALVDIYIIVLSEYSDYDFVRKAMNYGVSDYVLKPITKECIAQITDKILQIASDLQKVQYYNVLVTDKERIRETIVHMLRTGDCEHCKQMFSNHITTQFAINDVKRFCLVFLDELFEQMSNITLNQTELFIFKKEAVIKIENIHNVTDILLNTYNLCQQCVEIMSKKSNSSEEYIQTMLRYIEAHYQESDLSVVKVADYIHLSPVYAGCLFKQYKGINILAYIHEIRISESKRLMKNDSINISEISKRVGYLTPDYFTKVFKKSTGLLPTEYRNIITLQKRDEIGE